MGRDVRVGSLLSAPRSCPRSAGPGRRVYQVGLDLVGGSVRISGCRSGCSIACPEEFGWGNAPASNRIRGKLSKFSPKISGPARSSKGIMVTVYVLQSATTGRRYIGISSNLPRRLDEHNRNQSRATRGRGPWKLLYTESCSDYLQARKRERFLKSGPGHAFLREAGVA